MPVGPVRTTLLVTHGLKKELSALSLSASVHAVACHHNCGGSEPSERILMRQSAPTFREKAIGAVGSIEKHVSDNEKFKCSA